MCHVGMVDEQTQGVKLGFSKIANYNSSWMGSPTTVMSKQKMESVNLPVDWT